MDGVLAFAAVLATILGLPVLVFYVLLPIAKRIGGSAPDSDPGVLAEVERLREEMDLLRDAVSRLPELEERVDFAERMLARDREPGPLLADRNRENA